MSMKKIVLFSLMMACLPLMMVAQNANNDLYFIPKKKTEKKETNKGIPAKVVIESEKKAPTTVYASPGSTVVVKDLQGNVRDVDEYNRRYTSRDNTFTMENDTLYIEEKPYNERGEWVNGFEGSQSDYEYAMRIVRFRNPRYAIPVSSPLYWEVVYALPSWEWNVFDDGLYAYAFPTYSNSLWWDWRFNYSWGWRWRSPWYYNSWYSPGYLYGSYWGGWHHHHHHHPYWHHHYPTYGWAGVGGYWGGGHGWNGSSARRPGIHAGRYTNNYQSGYGVANTSSNRRVATSGNRNSRDNYVNGTRQSNARNNGTVRNSSGRVVTAKDGSASVRPQRSAVRTRNGEAVSGGNKDVRTNSVYTRPTQGRSSSYNRQSSTRSTVNNTGSSYQRKSGASERNAYRSGSSSGNSNNRSSYNSNRSSSSSRSSYSSGSSSSRSSYSSGGGSSRSSGGGGGSRSGGGRR